jgi:hypothetical protein
MLRVRFLTTKSEPVSFANVERGLDDAQQHQQEDQYHWYPE